MEIYEKIRYYREHTDFSQRSVAKILGVSRNTVKKYWEGQTVPWERKPGSGRKNDIITDEVRTFIIRCLESDKNAPRKQRHTAHKIYERLIAECGFEGCEASVRRTVAELRCNIHDIFVPLSYEPAEAVQVDWGEATIILGGCKQKIQIWCMRECFSGDIFVTAFYRQNEESFLEGIVTGLEHFGGTPQKIIFDNARVAVKEGFGYHAQPISISLCQLTIRSDLCSAILRRGMKKVLLKVWWDLCEEMLLYRCQTSQHLRNSMKSCLNTVGDTEVIRCRAKV